jgi:hypothetical protein
MVSSEILYASSFIYHTCFVKSKLVNYAPIPLPPYYRAAASVVLISSTKTPPPPPPCLWNIAPLWRTEHLKICHNILVLDAAGSCLIYMLCANPTYFGIPYLYDLLWYLWYYKYGIPYLYEYCEHFCFHLSKLSKNSPTEIVCQHPVKKIEFLNI